MKKYRKIITTIAFMILVIAVVTAIGLFFPGDPSIKAHNLASLPWYIARSAGITAYLLMYLTVILGSGMTSSYIYKLINPVNSWMIHKYLGIALSLTLLAHIFSLLFDNFIKLGWADLFIPFHSPFRTTAVALGVFGLYIIIAVMITSLFFRLKYQRSWRAVHYTVYPLFILSFFHGVYAGTDSSAFLVQIMYWFTGVTFAGLLLYRFLVYPLLRKS